MRSFVKIIMLMMVGTSVLTFIACHDEMKDPSDEAKKTLKTALDALSNGDVDTYLSLADFGTDMDSVQEASMRKVLRFHVDKMRKMHADVASIDIIDAAMKGDTVCTVYYQYTYSDSVKEVASQKMLMSNGAWKLRLRN